MINMKWIGAIFLAIVSSAAAWMWTQQYEDKLQSARFLKLKDNVSLIADETVLKDDMIEVAELPEKFKNSLSGFAIPASPKTYRASIVGSIATQDVPAGSLLFFQHFTPEQSQDLSLQLEKGKRALTLAVNVESTVGYFVRPGSRVDLIGVFVIPGEETATTADPRLAMQARVLLENVKVLAVGSARDFPEYQRISSRGYATVTFELTPEEANLVTFAQQQTSSPLTMVLRRSDEEPEKDAAPGSVTWQTLLEKTGSD
jgi:Flp pilus assembly protein CpaB